MSLVVPSFVSEGTDIREEEGGFTSILGTLLLVVADWAWWSYRPHKERVKELTLPSGLIISVGYGRSRPNQR